MEFIPIFAGGLILYLVIRVLVRLPGRQLAIKFKKLGNMTGKTKAQIVQQVGNPQSIRNIDNGQVCVWHAAGYTIALIFDANGTFIKINSETLVK